MIYLVRHAESIANTRGIYQGQTYDTPLSPLGHKQALALGRYFQNHSIHKIFSSPLKRTLTTAQSVAVHHSVPVIPEPSVIETNHGQWEGRSKSQIQKLWPEIYIMWQNNPGNVTFPGGESFVHTRNRIVNWWKIVSVSSGNILIVTHDNIIRIILAHLQKVDLNRIWEFPLHPASVTIVENNKITLLNHTDHLSGLMTNLSIHAL